jgi:acyl carrier protein
MTFHDFQLASQVKVDGTMALERAFASPSLEFFIMLSSAVNIVGASGQANYNAGNAVQDALAQVRQERHCRYISLNIGWIQDAVHTAENEARLAGLSRVGLRPIQSEELRRFFDFILANAYSTDQRLPQAIIGFDSGSLSNTTTHNGNLISPMFVHVRPNLAAITTLGSQDKTPPTATSFKQVLAAGERAAIIDFITAAICDQLSRLTSVDAARINADQSILELGLDSLIAIELRNWLTRTFDSPLQPSEILENQTVRTLGEKVASRSHLCQDPSSHEQNGTISQVNGNAKIENHTANESSLSPLPVPSLQETLRRFEESRRAIDSISEQKLTAGQVQAFIGGIGPILQEKVEGSKSSEIANSYERQIYLGRREPLQDYSEFTVGHPVDAPAHSQSLRAAIVTVAAAEFARQLASGEIPIDTLNGLPVSGEARNWLFWATRRPDNEVDYMERHTPSDTVIVLRRGHVFQLGLPSSNVPLQVAAVRAAFDDIMGLSEEPAPYVCTLTAGDRQSWFLVSILPLFRPCPFNQMLTTEWQARRELELETENSTILAAIDSAMFIICLDDESPITSGERHTQFLIGGQQPFINRWLDKPVQFAVTANGLSAGIYEHSKVDGLDVRMLHRHIVHALFNHDTVDNIDSSASVAHCTIHQHAWKTSPGVLKIMDSVKLQCDSYGYIDHLYFMAEELGLDHLRSHRISSHATAHIVALLAVYLVDKKIRPAWEIVSLANFAGGRLDWVQTVSPAIRSFLEKAAQLVESDDNKEDACRLLRSDFFTAVKGYSQVMSTAARGYGYVGHLYALHGAYLESQENVNTDKPDIFRGNAWNATRRGGLHQNFKIGFMPDDEPDYPHSWDEGGFLMHGDEGVYIHCGIRDHGIAFAISARPDYAKAVCKSLDHASKLISLVL